jgi:hypothetical protein
MRDRTRQVKLPPESEDETQKVIVDGLHAYGYLVQITTRRRKKCRTCGAWNHQGDGASKGLADLLVRHPTWIFGLWVQLEVKRPGRIKWACPEQQIFAEQGDIVVVQSLEAALVALKNVDGMRS